MLWLVKNGIPFHIAFGIDKDEAFEFSDKERTAIAIILGQFEGGEFDWDLMEWKKRG